MATTASITFSGGGLRNGDIAAGAGIDASKVVHHTTHNALVFPSATSVAAVTYPLLVVDAETSELISFKACVFAAATGADRTATIDLQKSTAGGAFATILSDTIVFDDDSSPRVVEDGVIQDEDLVVGDVLAVVVTVAGAAGAQATGLLVSVTTHDQPVE